MRLLCLLLATVLLGICSASAAASGADVIRDCTDDEVMSKTYTQREYRDALRELGADADQYGNCRDVIRRAQQAALAARDRGGSGDSGDSTAPQPAGGGNDGGAGAIGSPPAEQQLAAATDAERSAIEAARTDAAEPVVVDATNVGVAPGVSDTSSLPTPVAVLLALLLAGALVLAGIRVKGLVDARRA